MSGFPTVPHRPAGGRNKKGHHNDTPHVRIMKVGMLAMMALLAWPIAPRGQETQDPVALVANLRQRGMLAGELRAQVATIAAVLADAAGRWERVQVNGAYDPGALNIYLVNLPAPPAQVGLLEGTRSTLRSFPLERIILADASYLARLKAASDVYSASIQSGDHAVSAHDALVIATVEGPDAAERARLGAAADWRRSTGEPFEGAVAFLLAHEMRHVVMGLAPLRPASVPRGLKGRDRDRVFACTSMLDEGVAGDRQREEAADEFAIRLLGSIPAPTPPRRLRYELGTLFLLNGELGKLVTVLMALNPRAAALAARAGLAVEQAAVSALSAGLGRDDGLIETVFPASHPAFVDRLLTAAASFAANPTSLSYRNPSAGLDQQSWRMLVQLLCQGIGNR
jgi:hypothetical protein